MNENFDAKSWGLELESVFAPTPNLRVNFNMGYLNTRIGKGQASIDIMNRTQGDPNYTLVKPWMQLPSNCVVPTHVAETWANKNFGLVDYYGLCGGLGGVIGGFFPAQIPDTNFGGANYDPANYPELNGGAGIRADLGGHELPNAPHWTANFGIQHSWAMSDDWEVTLRGDAYWQGKSWARVYNYAPYDRLRDWTNFNLSVRVDGPENLTFEAYVKNVFNKSPITDAFLNSDDTGLTTNVFTLDPRIIGFSIAKKF